MNENPSPAIEKPPIVPTMDVVAPAPQETPATPQPAQAQKVVSEKAPETKKEVPSIKESPKPTAIIFLTLLVSGGLIALAIYAQLQKS